MLGSGFAPDSDVVITLDGDPTPLRTAHTDGNGNFTIWITLPPGTTPGGHAIVASGQSADDSSASPTAPITVPVPVTPPPTSTGHGSAESTTPTPSLLALVLLAVAATAAILKARRLERQARSR